MLQWDWSKDEWAYHVICCRASLLIRNGCGFVLDARKKHKYEVKDKVKTKGWFFFAKCVFLWQPNWTELLKNKSKNNLYSNPFHHQLKKKA